MSRSSRAKPVPGSATVPPLPPADPVPRPVPDRLEASRTFVTVRDWVRYGTSRLAAAGTAFGHGTGDAYDEAVWLVCWSLALPLDRYGDLADARVTAVEADRIIAVLERRCTRREPLAYVIGEAWLCGYRFHADARALVPRSPIAEAVTGGALDPFLSDRPPRAVLDLCAGSASLAIIAADRWPGATVIASDNSAAALALAARNVALHEMAERIRLVEADLYGGLRRQRFDLILCNPPYVNARSLAALAPEFQAEPRAALAGGADGLVLITRIIAGARRHLEPDGLLVIEVGHEADAFERRFARTGHAWIPVAAGDRMLAAVRASGLPTGAG
ncbi:MAG: 50S ribosomal protein L3 N(5)-glutamine methyltransferase [Burkholderiaceae bacterium]